MKCGVAEGWQYPSTGANLLTAGARWRYSLAQERSAHSDTTASVCALGSLAVIYDAPVPLLYHWHWFSNLYTGVHAYGQRWALTGRGTQQATAISSAKSMVSQETTHVTDSLEGSQMSNRMEYGWWIYQKEIWVWSVPICGIVLGKSKFNLTFPLLSFYIILPSCHLCASQHVA